jgi:predicted nucleic acid-binding protein
MIVVADTGPLIALSKLDRMDLLDVFDGTVVIPPYVKRELLSKPATETEEIEQALSSRLHVQEVPPLSAATQEVVDRLDPGERQAVSLAAELDEDTVLLMDDQAGRRAARRLECSVTGVIGLLLRAKETARIDTVTPLLTQLKEAGYWLSDEIIEQAKELAGEATDAPEDAGASGP